MVNNAQHAPHKRYPFEWVDVWRARGGERVLIRPVHPQDAELAMRFVRELSPSSRYNRFHQPLRELTPAMARWATDVDHDRHIALIAEVFQDGQEVEIGVARYVVGDAGDVAEIAVAVADAWQRQGVGERLLHGLVQIAARRGLAWLEGEVLKDNAGMLALARRAGFAVRSARSGLTVKIDRRITPADAANVLPARPARPLLSTLLGRLAGAPRG
jgi:acetyltransferase